MIYIFYLLFLPIEHRVEGFRWKQSQPRLVDIFGKSEGGGVKSIAGDLSWRWQEKEMKGGIKVIWKLPFAIPGIAKKIKNSKIHKQGKLLFDNQPAVGYHRER